MSHEIFLVARVALSSAGAPERLGSLVVAHGLGCSAACGFLFPRPWIELVYPALQDGSPPVEKSSSSREVLPPSTIYM